MPSSKAFQIQLRRPEHGWAETTIKLGDTEVFIDASDVGPDSFRQLASAAIFALTAHSGSQQVEFFEEPAGVILVVAAVGDGMVRITIGRTRHIVEPFIAPTNEVASLEMAAEDFALGVWRSLRANEAMLRDAYANEDWREYPEAEVAALTKVVTERTGRS